MSELFKTCSQCNIEKPLTDFNKASKGRFKVRADCRACQKAAESLYYSTEVGKLARFKQWLKTRYGLSIEEYEKLVAKHDGNCAICNNPPTSYFKLYIDHDHATGKVRGLLCSQCNSLLGMAKENITTLQAAISYLEEATQELPQGSTNQPSELKHPEV